MVAAIFTQEELPVTLATVADFVALNYNTAGTKLLTLKYNGTGNNEDVGKQVILDNNGYLYITGYSVGTGAANYDFATVKFCTPLPEATITAGGATSICIGDSVSIERKYRGRINLPMEKRSS
jgi:hypothetical protein